MNALRLTGIIGLIGALLCGTGEFLLHFDPEARFSGYDFMADISDARLTRGHFFAVIGVKGVSFGQRLLARNFSSAEGRGDSNFIALPETGCSKPSDLACNAIRLRIHRGCIACLDL